MARMALLLAAMAVAAVAAVDATVLTTCMEAADKSKGKVDYGFCVSELGKHRDSPGADAWGLAKVAALTGVVNADNAAYDIKDLLEARPKDGQAALRLCEELYGKMGFAFAVAQDKINGRHYAAGKAKAEEAATMAHQCDAALAKEGAAPPVVTKYGSYTAKIAAVCTAITDLIH